MGPSLRYLEKRRGLVGQLLTGGLRFDPWDLLKTLAQRPVAARSKIVGIHWSTFNAVEPVVGWVTEQQQRLGCTGTGQEGKVRW